MIRSVLAIVLFASVIILAQMPGADLGYTDTPMLPGLPYRVHDPSRPHPAVITPGAQTGAAPSDAIVLFGGTDLSQWTTTKQPWKVENGYVEVVPNAGDIRTKENVRRRAAPRRVGRARVVRGTSQNRGNSGIFLQGRYEVQVLDSFENPTYADGQAGAIYGQWPPLVNPVRKPGEWQTYDIVFEAPRFDGGKVVKPAYLTVFLNGVLLHHRKEADGADRSPRARLVRAAARRGLTGPAGSSAARAVPQHLDSSAERLRQTPVEADT